jgi:hypothetical protein
MFASLQLYNFENLQNLQIINFQLNKLQSAQL